MPRAGDTKIKPPVIEKAVRRHLEADVPVVDLAKELKVSRQTVYSWIETYRQKAMDSVDRIGKSKAELENIDKATLIARVQYLESANTKLRDRVVKLMLKYGEIP